MNILGILTLLVFAAWQAYWKITERQADQEKPKDKHINHWIERYLLTAAGLVILFQVVGWPLFPFSFPGIQMVGFLLVVTGMSISVVARATLGANWAHAADYQIKKNHTLITQGIYGVIRHPIYTGLLLALTGAELVAQSKLFVVVFLAMLVWSYTRGKREEKILEAHFGKAYAEYKKRSKMLIPFVR